MATNRLKAFAKQLEAAAAAYPEATKDHPWGETVFKVKGKVFIFLGMPSDGLSFSMKLPQSAGAALMLPFASPTEYGLGKSGWITGRFAAGDDVPEGLLIEWLEESYRAVAPKKLVKQLDAGAVAPAAVPAKATTKRAKAPAKAARKSAPKPKR